MGNLVNTNMVYVLCFCLYLSSCSYCYMPFILTCISQFRIHIYTHFTTLLMINVFHLDLYWSVSYFYCWYSFKSLYIALWQFVITCRYCCGTEPIRTALNSMWSRFQPHHVFVPLHWSLLVSFHGFITPMAIYRSCWSRSIAVYTFSFVVTLQ